jgi:hypothetical protein
MRIKKPSIYYLGPSYNEETVKKREGKQAWTVNLTAAVWFNSYKRRLV